MELTTQISNLMTDMIQNRVGVYAKDKAEHADDAVRNLLIKLLGAEKLTYNKWQQYKHQLFSIVSDVLNVTAPNAMRTNPFFMELAEIKNGADGEMNEFVIPDNSHLIVSKFSGNHWNTIRQKRIGDRSVSLPTEWYSVRIYEELDRIMKGISKVTEMFKSLQEALEQDINDRVYTAFGSANIYLPNAFKESGVFSKDAMLGLIERVQAATKKDVKLIGTRQGLSKISADLGAEWVSESMKEERNKTGVVKYWEGVGTVRLPQSFMRGTYDFAINPNVIKVVPAGYKPVKIWYEGDNRIRDLESTETIDQTVDIEIQSKLGVGVIMADLFGEYTIT